MTDITKDHESLDRVYGRIMKSVSSPTVSKSGTPANSRER